MSDLQKTLDERGANYGCFTYQAGLSQGLKQMCFKHLDEVNPTGAKQFTPYMAEGLEMILHKIARIVNGNPFHSDSWRDIAGYATIVADRVEAASSVGHIPVSRPATVHMHEAPGQSAKETQREAPEIAPDQMAAPASAPLSLDEVDQMMASNIDASSEALAEPERSLETAFDKPADRQAAQKHHSGAVHIPDNAIHRV